MDTRPARRVAAHRETNGRTNGRSRGAPSTTAPVIGPDRPGSLDADVEARSAVETLLRSIGEDPTRDGLLDTPRRVVASLRELTRGTTEDVAAVLATTFTEDHEESVLMHGIEFWSLCEHHLLPFHGTATVAYIPNGRVVGLSKLSRTVQAFARRLQVQERMTDEIADALSTHLDAHGVAVHVEARHLCMAMRGVRSTGTTVTRAFRGTYEEKELRREFLQSVTTGAVGL